MGKKKKAKKAKKPKKKKKKKKKKRAKKTRSGKNASKHARKSKLKKAQGKKFAARMKAKGKGIFAAKSLSRRSRASWGRRVPVASTSRRPCGSTSSRRSLTRAARSPPMPSWLLRRRPGRSTCSSFRGCSRSTSSEDSTALVHACCP